ncbi:hypothetical protein [Methylobacterium nonmethylotrophicum]|uniref:Uncharacterized protein n=1 Tax=Methylobacterium nonmethylotrophicum TaxID=1141884 RepID=A0A4Z0NGX2_9HYPH|nr:hypothetical protein [Methylobacterium nonmethylotrophicum]TGD94903.1 hypothetical protein EU555_30480 [Methylobacterium nonmethylotrophicum]
MSQPLIAERKSGQDWGLLYLEIQRWFQESLCQKSGSEKISEQNCIFLSDKLRVTFNRADNEERIRRFRIEQFERDRAAASDDEMIFRQRNNPERGLIESLRDIDVEKYNNDKIDAFLNAARNLLYEAENIRDYFGNYMFTDKIDLDEICAPLEEMGLVAKKTLPLGKTAQGRPESFWREVGKTIANDIRAVAKQEGYGRTGLTDGLSVTAYVGAQAVNWAFGTFITPVGFADAMKRKRRIHKRHDRKVAPC